jgi:hypothetical protein
MRPAPSAPTRFLPPPSRLYDLDAQLLAQERHFLSADNQHADPKRHPPLNPLEQGGRVRDRT